MVPGAAFTVFVASPFLNNGGNTAKPWELNSVIVPLDEILMGQIATGLWSQ